MFYIKRISLLTGNNVVSFLELGSGLNIIYGQSNTGKSLVVDCIDYMFGAKDHRFDEKLQVKALTLVLDVDGKNLTMRREIGKNDIEISGTVEFIDNDTYKIGDSKKSINNVWLRLMGIEEEVKIIQTLAYKTQRLTLRTFYHVLLIDEQRVQGVNSILMPGVGYKGNNTPTMTSLLYFATGDTYLQDQKIEDPKLKKAKREAVKAFVDRSMSDLAERRIEIFENPVENTPEELQQKIDKIINEIGAVEGALEQASNKSKALASRIIEIDNQIAESRMLNNRNNSLKTAIQPLR